MNNIELAHETAAYMVKLLRINNIELHFAGDDYFKDNEVSSLENNDQWYQITLKENWVNTSEQTQVMFAVIKHIRLAYHNMTLDTIDTYLRDEDEINVSKVKRAYEVFVEDEGKETTKIFDHPVLDKEATNYTRDVLRDHFDAHIVGLA